MAKTEKTPGDNLPNDNAAEVAVPSPQTVQIAVGEHVTIDFVELPNGYTLVITTVEKMVSGTPLLAVSTEMIQPK